MGLSLASAPIIAQTLGPDGRGLSASAVAAITITGVVCGLGVPLAVRRRAALSADRGDIVRSARAIGWAMSIPAAATGVLLLVTTLGALSLASQVAFLIGMAASALTVSWATDMNIMITDQRYFRMVCISSVQTLAYFAVILILWLTQSLSVEGVIYAYTAGTVTAFALGRFWVRTGSARASQVRSLLREGFRLWGSQAAEVANARLDQLIVLPIIGAGATGIYSVAVTIGALPASIGVGLGAAAFRGFVKDGSAQKIAPAVRAATATALIFAILIGVASIWVIPVLFGDAFVDSIPVAAITLAGSIAVVGSYIGSIAMVARGHGLRMTSVQAVGLAVGIALVFPAGHLWGAMGAATASTIGYWATFVGAVAVLRLPLKSLLIRPSDYIVGIRLFLGRAPN